MTDTVKTPIMVELADEAATAALAARVSARAQAGDVFALSGPLGSGKTVFARAFINAVLSVPSQPLAARKESINSARSVIACDLGAKGFQARLP